MTTYEKLYLIISASGFLMVIVSVSVLIYQTVILRRSLDVGSNSSVGGRQLEVDKLLVENPHLLKYFLKNVTISPTHQDYDAALAFALLLANFYNTFLLQKDKFQQIYPVESWIGYITDYLSTSPILRDHIEEYQRWYTPELLTLKRAADKALRQNAAARNLVGPERRERVP
jgi:hypothetical protein